MKVELREKFLKLRLEMSNEEVQSKSSKVLDHIKENLEDKKKVLLYMPIKNEVDLTELILDQDFDCFLPYVKDEVMYAAKIDNLEDLEEGKYGIKEPKDKLPSEEFDIVLVPGIVFDKDGNRIGFGKGYYDKFLANTKVKKIGVCFQKQIVNKLQSEDHDIAMDCVITEEGVQ